MNEKTKYAAKTDRGLSGSVKDVVQKRVDSVVSNRRQISTQRLTKVTSIQRCVDRMMPDAVTVRLPFAPARWTRWTTQNKKNKLVAVMYPRHAEN